jgi:hypothetical protein
LDVRIEFNPQEDQDDIPLFQKISAYLTFSLDSGNNSQHRSESILPIEEEEVRRTYQWSQSHFQSISIPVTADLLDIGSLEVRISQIMS